MERHPVAAITTSQTTGPARATYVRTWHSRHQERFVARTAEEAVAFCEKLRKIGRGKDIISMTQLGGDAFTRFRVTFWGNTLASKRVKLGGRLV
jgi:hypothetical protein